MAKTSGKPKSKVRRVEEALKVPRVMLKRTRKEQKKDLSGKPNLTGKKSSSKSPKAGSSKTGFPCDLPSDCPICGFTMSR